MRKGKYIFITIFSLLLTGCKVQQPVVEEAVRPELLGETQMTDEEPVYSDWHDIFTDAGVQTLIAEALQNNADVRSVQQSVEQAATLLRTAKLAYLPTFAFTPGGTLTKAGSGNWSKSYELPLTMQWQVNLAGGEAHQKEASRYAWMQMNERLRYTQVQLIASVANAYYTLIMLDEQLQLTRQHVALQEETISTLEAMKEVGMSNDLAIQQAVAVHQETKISLSDLALNRTKVEQALNLLLGRTPGAIVRADIRSAGDIKMNTDAPVSLATLASRPDVKDAEYALRASFSNTKVARSKFYPTLQITAGGSWTNNLGEIVNPGQFLLNLIGSLTQPLFMQGQVKGQFDIARSQQQQAEIAFEQSLLQAGGEVCNALAECCTAKEKMLARQRQVEAAEKAFANSKVMMEHASTNYLEVLTAQSSCLTAQLQSTADWLEAQQGAINLFNALCPVLNMNASAATSFRAFRRTEGSGSRELAVE